MIIIEDYIKLTLKERQKHLDLSSSCDFRGGDSHDFRGLLAHFLDTTIPFRKQIHLCHACGVGGCSNPKHLYWGTPKENTADAMSSGVNVMILENIRRKYGEEGARNIIIENGIKGGKRVGNMIWITDGQIDRRIEKNSFVPNGWRRGRTTQQKTKILRSMNAARRIRIKGKFV